VKSRARKYFDAPIPVISAWAAGKIEIDDDTYVDILR
jgi:hypothetical protein